MMDDAYYIMLLNIQMKVDQFLTLVIDKSSHQIIKQNIEKMKTNQVYIQGNELEQKNVKAKKCGVCHLNTSKSCDAFKDIECCEKCSTKTISKTDAKNIYKLNQVNLDQLDFIMVYLKCYRKYGKFYSLKDVRGIALSKHGAIYPPEKVNAAKNKREEQLNKALEIFENDKELQNHFRNSRSCIIFLQNGEGGINRLKQRFKRYPEFCKVIQEYPHITPNMYMGVLEIFFDFPNVEEFKHSIENEMAKDKRRQDINELLQELNMLSFHTHSIIQQYVNYGNNNLDIESVIIPLYERQERETKLKEGLALHGLVMRSDSFVCKEYIENNSGSLNETIRMMREMHFFFSSTNYKNIMGQMMRDEYAYQREEMYDNDDSTEEDYQIDHSQVSKNAKIRALRLYKGTVPDYVGID